jgi:hypothetical protein
VVWLGVVAASTGYDYFVRWGESPETRAAYFHNLAAITDYLNDTEYSGDITLSSPFPDLPLDPFIADMRLQREDLALRWCDARRSLAFPDTSRAVLILPSNTPLDPYLDWRLDLQPIERVYLRPDDVDPHFDVFEWSPDTALRRFLAPSTQTVTAKETPFDLPVRFGEVVELLAYNLPETAVGAGEAVPLVTVWRILEPAALGPPPTTEYGNAAVIFAHVLDASDFIVGQEDRLDAPAWNWRPGDAFVQILRLRIKPDVPPGLYRLKLGLYTRADGVRLPVLVQGAKQDHHVFLQTLEIESQ